MSSPRHTEIVFEDEVCETLKANGWLCDGPRTYLSNVSKAQIVQALKEAGPDLAEDGVGAMKKDMLVVKAASRLAGRWWLPEALLPRSAPER